jgi:hypothetical protein
VLRGFQVPSSINTEFIHSIIISVLQIHAGKDVTKLSNSHSLENEVLERQMVQMLLMHFLNEVRYFDRSS